jgi:hypothetical protein
LKNEAGTGFCVYLSGYPESSFCLREPNAVFTSEMSEIFVALIQIRAHSLGIYLMLTDSKCYLKALETHSMVYEIKEAC